MTILAFDTCFGAVSAAVRLDSGTGEPRIVSVIEPMAKGHAERLLPVIAATLQKAGIGYGDLSRIAVTLGPGGFTGLRAGIAAARGIALSTGLPVAGASSLAVMARAAVRHSGTATPNSALVVAVDARRGEVYLEVFDTSGGASLTAARLATTADAVNLLPRGKTLIVGSGALALAKQSGRTDVTAALPDLQPDASDLVTMAEWLPPLAHVTPNYLRAADAKVQSANVLARIGR